MTIKTRRFPLAVCLLAILASMTANAALTGRNLAVALRSGGYVILMRHASSPRLPPQPAEVDPGNVGHERQLDGNGRASAREMGDAVRRLRIPIGQVLSSPTYRALETVRLAGLGVAKTFPQLGDAGQSMRADTSGARGAWLRQHVAVRPPPGTNTIIITHAPNISEAFPKDGKGLEDGEALIFRPDGHGTASLIASVKIDEWPRWAASP